ncbi:hypothetical protein Pelo_14444 [Pelomyxa schiedti]|nr:hypothetical protein Pelo_14444 [Pelomyxa schiedti]
MLSFSGVCWRCPVLSSKAMSAAFPRGKLGVLSTTNDRAPFFFVKTENSCVPKVRVVRPKSPNCRAVELSTTKDFDELVWARSISNSLTKLGKSRCDDSNNQINKWSAQVCTN